MYNDIAKTSRKIIKQIIKEPVVTDFILLFDRSGSMSGQEDYVAEGLASLLKISPDLRENIRFTTVLFDSTIVIPCERVNMKEAKKIKYQIGGSTSMNDAIGATINYIEECHKNEKTEFDEKELEMSMKKRDYQIREYIKPDVHILIYSDGQENSSTIYTIEDIKQLIHFNVENNNYTFYYCGDFSLDANEIASQYGIPEHLTESYVCSEGGFKGFFRMVQRLIKELAEHGKLISTWKELTKGASPLEGIKDKYICDIFNHARKLLKTNEDILSKLEISARTTGYDDEEFKKSYSEVMINSNEIRNITKTLKESGHLKLDEILNEYIKKQQQQSRSICLNAVTHTIQSLLSINLISINKIENITLDLKSLNSLEFLYTNIVTNLDKIELFIAKDVINDFTSMQESFHTLVKEQNTRLYLALHHILKARRIVIRQIISQANYTSFKIRSEKIPNPIAIWYKKLLKTFYFSKEEYDYNVSLIEEAALLYSLSKTLKRMLMNSNSTLNEYINDDFKFNQWLTITETFAKEQHFEDN